MPDTTVIENLIIKAGADWSRTWPVFDETGEPMDLTGATAHAQVRNALVGGQLLADLAPVIDHANHAIDIQIDAATSLGWTWQYGYWDLYLTVADGTTYNMTAGKVRVRPAVTHA